MTDDKSLTRQTLGNFKHDEVWEVYVSNQREPYILNEVEFAILKDAILKGVKATITYDRFGINLSYFVSYYLRSRTLKKEFQLKAPEPEEYKEPTPEQRARTAKLLEEMRKKLGVRLSADR